MALQTPVLFCIFNRPDVTRQVFASIRRQQPKTLFVIQDGPRPGHQGDPAQIAAARHVLDTIDWHCDLQTNFAEINLGCKQRMASGITWGFEQSERLIILEDDCLASDSFFPYCESLLTRYADDDRVMMISGDNFQPVRRTPHSYYFSKWAHIWGWASWRRAWEHLDIDLRSWPDAQQGSWLSKLSSEPSETLFWTELFDRQSAGAIDTWDFPWMYSCWEQGGLTILPHRNLVTNLGFGPQATHTTDESSRWGRMPRGEIDVLDHPQSVVRNIDADAHTWNAVFKPPLRQTKTKRGAKLRNWWRGIRRAVMGSQTRESCHG